VENIIPEKIVILTPEQVVNKVVEGTRYNYSPIEKFVLPASFCFEESNSVYQTELSYYGENQLDQDLTYLFFLITPFPTIWESLWRTIW